jgi:hypothetical protein
MSSLNFTHITRKWTPLRAFAGTTIEVALDAIRGGKIYIAQYFAKLLYFLKFAPTSIEKVLLYSLAKASKGYVEKDPSLYEISASEIPGFEPDEMDKVKMAFKSLSRLGVAKLVTPDTIKLEQEVVDKIVEPIAHYIAKDINLRDVDPDAASYPYKIISGVSALFVMYEINRLPRSFTIMAGLLSPVAHVDRGIVRSKSTIELNEWVQARNQMRKLRPLRDRFDVEYFKAIGFLYENRIITASYPVIEVAGSFVDYVVVPAYKVYYERRLTRRIMRARK